jgi:UDP-glucose 4-epimerase
VNVFVTGGAGFIGAHLCLRLLEQGHTVTAYDNLSLGRRQFLTPCLAQGKFKFIEQDLLGDAKDLKGHLAGQDLVFHLAANSDIARGGKETDLDLNQGLLATYNLLEGMREAAVKKIVFASTSAVYGETEVRPTPESFGPLKPISFYGASKLACEVFISAFAHHYGMQTWIFRFANVVGSNLTHGAIYDFITRLNKDPRQLQVLGDGRQRKSYLHVSDCIDGMIFAHSKASADVNIFNLASRGISEVRFIAEEVCRQVAPQARLIYGKEDRGWKGDVPITWLDDRLLRELGWTAKVDSDEAIRRAIREELACRRSS